MRNDKKAFHTNGLDTKSCVLWVYIEEIKKWYQEQPTFLITAILSRTAQSNLYYKLKCHIQRRLAWPFFLDHVAQSYILKKIQYQKS